MKKIALLFFVVFSVSLYAQETGIRFSKDSLLSDALAKSQKEGKLVFIDCYTSWCGPCKHLSKEIFPLKAVGDFYNSHFINLSFDMEKSEGIKIRTKYAVQAYPTLLFLNAQGETVHVGIGALDANALIELGKTALDDTRNILSISKKMKAGDKSIQTLALYLKNNHYAADKDALINEYFKTATDDEKLSEDAWELFKEHINDIDNDQFQYFLKHRSGYEQKFGKMDVENKIIYGFGYYLQKYKADPQKAASVQSIDPVLYSKFLVMRNFMLASYEQYSQKNDKGKWNDYIAKAKPYVALDNIQPMAINDICWNIYENYRTFNDTATLKLAKEWQEKVHKALPDNHPINDTYAHILFDLGFVKEAIEHEALAIKVATEMNSTKDLTFYADEIEKFKKAQ
ncbi:MAG TPA: thioredoxin fold domain-containing protein [Paludibacter sp.]|nr:thioredoxin fold domain-containing protein [Paludibacter sp.]